MIINLKYETKISYLYKAIYCLGYLLPNWDHAIAQAVIRLLPPLRSGFDPRLTDAIYFRQSVTEVGFSQINSASSANCFTKILYIYLLLGTGITSQLLAIVLSEFSLT
jgi:hypothetical protein